MRWTQLVEGMTEYIVIDRRARVASSESRVGTTTSMPFLP